MKTSLRIVATVVLLLGFPHTARAQVSWSGAYAGFDLGAGFKDLDFTVADSVQAGAYKLVSGHAGHGVSIGGHAGWDFQIAKRFVVGGEAGFGELGYHGAVQYSLGNDTLGETISGFSWTAMARAGYVYKQVMPYFAAGVLGSKNTGHVIDDCNTHPCGDSLGEGSGTVSATHWVLAVGAQFASTRRIAGRGWAVRLDWMQLEPTPIMNNFQNAVVGVGIPPGKTFPVTVTTTLPHGMVRLLFDMRLTK